MTASERRIAASKRKMAEAKAGPTGGTGAASTVAGPTGPTGPTGPVTVLYNANVTDQLCTANTENYITGSSLDIASKVQVKTRLRWRFSATKTAAGTGVPAWSIRFGAGATITDTIRCAITGLAQTAATDTCVVDVESVVRTAGATAVVQSVLKQVHRNGVSGFQNTANPVVVQALSTPFDITTANIKAGISVNPGVSGVWSFQLIEAWAENVI